MGNLSAHLDSSEVRCHCGCHIGNDGKDFSHETALTFEQLRKYCSNALGKDTPLEILSGYRCEKHNAETPNATPHSQHLLGTALDIACPDGLPYDLFYSGADKLNPDGGVGKYPEKNFVHIDTRGKRARWEG